MGLGVLFISTLLSAEVVLEEGFDVGAAVVAFVLHLAVGDELLGAPVLEGAEADVEHVADYRAGQPVFEGRGLGLAAERGAQCLDQGVEGVGVVGCRGVAVAAGGGM